MFLRSQKTPGQSLSEMELLSYGKISKKSLHPIYRKKILWKVENHLLKNKGK